MAKKRKNPVANKFKLEICHHNFTLLKNSAADGIKVQLSQPRLFGELGTVTIDFDPTYSANDI